MVKAQLENARRQLVRNRVGHLKTGKIEVLRRKRMKAVDGERKEMTLGKVNRGKQGKESENWKK